MASVAFLLRAKAAAVGVRRRIGPAALVVLIHLLLLLMLLRLAPDMVMGPRGGRPPLLVDLLPDDQQSEATQTKTATKPKASAARKAAAAKRAVTPPPPDRPVPPPPPTVSPVWSQLIPLSSQEMAQADLARMPQKSADAGDSAAGRKSAAAGSGGGSGQGQGPHGEQLYDADWYREPTSAELGPYLPKNGPKEGWGLIACKTVDNFRVEDCVVLGQSPEGSGFGRAALNAAWQFRVRPPRIGGKSMVGEWVRIRIEYSERSQ